MHLNILKQSDISNYTRKKETMKLKCIKYHSYERLLMYEKDTK